jgi:cytochrome c1
MIYSRTITPAILVILLAALPGCKSKQDKAGQVPEQKNAQGLSQPAPAQPQQPAAGPVVAPPQDESEAAAVKARVLSQVKDGEFAAIYKEASAGFKAVGPEEQFIAQWNKQLQETGAFKDAKESGHTVRSTDKFIVFSYVVQYERKKKELVLTIGRSKKGKMELTGINQREIK